MKDESTPPEARTEVAAERLHRRAVLGAAAWTAPAIVAAGAAPAFAASGATAITITSPAAAFVVNNRTETQSIQATLTGPAVGGRTVTFEVSSPSGASTAWLSFTSTTAQTNGSGVASTSLVLGTPKPTPGATFTVTATYQDLSATRTFTYVPNLAIYRVGGTTNVAQRVYIDEVTSVGSAVDTVAMPIAASGANRPFTQSGSADTNGALSLSTDRRYLVAAGYGAVPGTAGVANTASASVPRVVGRIDQDGVVNTSTAVGNAFNNDNFRAAASDNGARFWLSGVGESSTGGVRLATLGATTASSVAAAPNNARVVVVAGGRLYVSSASGSSTGVNVVGTGLPTTSGQSPTRLVDPGSNSEPVGFAFFDRSTTTAGVDTLYVTDDASGTGGLYKYFLNGSGWTAAGRVTTTPTRHVTGYVAVNGNVVLFATTTTNQLVTVTDTSAYNGTAAPTTPTTLASAPSGNVWRGVAFAPDA